MTDDKKFNQLFIKTAQIVHQELTQNELGLTGLHLLVLMTVYDAPGITMSTLAQTLNISKAQLSRMIGKLEYQHLLKRVHNADNRRIVNVYTLPEGDRLVIKRLALARAHLQDRFKKMDAIKLP